MKFNKTQLFKLKKALLQLSEMATEEGVTLVVDDELGVGVEVFVNGDEGLVPASDGTYNWNGQVITVEGGVVTNIAEANPVEETPTEEEEPATVEEETAEEETPAEEQPTEETPVEEVPAEVAETAEEIIEEVTEEVVDVEALKTRIAELEALVEELNKKLEEPVAESVEEEMKKDEKPQKQEMNYVAAIKKAREINIKRK